MFPANVVEVFISTPSDTDDEVEAIKQSLHSLNTSRGKRDGVLVLPVHWKSDAVPRMSAEGAQGVINKQLLDKADIVVALFDTRLGQATPDAVSGTAHEISRATEAGKHVHTWFSEEPIERRAVDPEELVRLAEYRKELEGQGLLGVYVSPEDLAHKVRTAVEQDIDEMGLGTAQLPTSSPRTERAMPRLSRIDNLLSVSNVSTTVTAAQFAMEVRKDNRVRVRYDGEPFDLLPLADYQWPLIVGNGADKLVITMRWFEDGEPQEATQNVAV
jgi:hypothetical protein